MSEAEFQIAKIKALLDIYVIINKLAVESEDEYGRAWKSLYFIERRLREALE